jgi:hypothetical protein
MAECWSFNPDGMCDICSRTGPVSHCGYSREFMRWMCQNCFEKHGPVQKIKTSISPPMDEVSPWQENAIRQMEDAISYNDDAVRELEYYLGIA